MPEQDGRTRCCCEEHNVTESDAQDWDRHIPEHRKVSMRVERRFVERDIVDVYTWFCPSCPTHGQMLSELWHRQFKNWRRWYGGGKSIPLIRDGKIVPGEMYRATDREWAIAIALAGGETE